MGRDSYSNRQIVENCLILSSKMIKDFINVPDKMVIMEWQNSAKIAVMFRNEPERLEFRYTINGDPVEYSVYITQQTCNYGNYRYYFECPSCSKKQYKLYLPLYGSGSFGVWCNYFMCRECHNLTYRKQKKHNKSDNKYRWNWYLIEANKLVTQGEHKTAKGRRKIQRLKEKSDKCMERYGHLFLQIMDKFTSKYQNNRNI